MSDKKFVPRGEGKIKPLDGKRFEVLKFVYHYKEAHDYSPSNREIARAIPDRFGKPTSTSVIALHLRSLRKRYGYINFIPRQSRTVHLTPAGRQFITAHLLPVRIKQKRDQLSHS